MWWQIEYKEYLSFLFKIIFKLNTQKKSPYKTVNNNFIKAFWVLSNDEVSRWQIEYKEYLSFLFKIIFKLIKDIFERR